MLSVALANAKTHKVVERITATREHPFYVRGKGFVPAGGLAVGNAIVTRAGPALVVQSITWNRRAEGYTVYNFVVEDDHSYFVGTHDGGAWVHNPICPTQPYRGPGGGHHIHAKAAFRGLPYNENAATAIARDVMDSNGWNHMGAGGITAAQRRLFDQLAVDVASGAKQNTLIEHSRVAYEALIAGGLTNEEASSAVIASLRELERQGIIAPSGIPWN